jgi:purine nucleosidase
MSATGAAAPPQPLIFSHDGGVDDYVALALLAALLGPGGQSPSHALQGVIVTGADCFLEPALAATSGMLALFAPGVALVRSVVRGANAFPHQWRSTSLVVAQLPLLLRAAAAVGPGAAGGGAVPRSHASDDRGHAHPVAVVSSDAPRWLADTLLASPVPVDIIETGPLTTIAAALALEPACAAKIGRL